MALCLEDKMENLVKPEMKNLWENESRKWFVMDPDDAWDLRHPGKMKLEWSTTTGAMIAYVIKLFYFDTIIFLGWHQNHITRLTWMAALQSDPAKEFLMLSA